MSSRIRLARTWNANASGLLWERLWAKDDQGYYSQLLCSGVFIGPERYIDADSFWKTFHQEQEKVSGEVIDA